jgi:hypothetical protein
VDLLRRGDRRGRGFLDRLRRDGPFAFSARAADAGLDPVRALIAALNVADNVVYLAYAAHVEAYEELQVEHREDLAIRIANATWGESK